ncbi:hypothetical protein V0288_21770 [Pannus brasiliensis CCIBt3594]|uniref:non-specific serine/threonine protein kinase n=1 Tax=Pannus brasiliensis CCIBt3594 TaxID=1427578 RepID=A0AAW9QZE5_9CHRO
MLDRVLHSRYEIQQVLGQKAGTRTVLARDRQSRQLVLVRISLFPVDVDRERVDRMKNKIELLQSLRHESIPPVLDSFEVETPERKGWAIARPFLRSKSLEEYINPARLLPESEIKQIAKYCLEILFYLHQQHPPIFHGNLKPSNIFFDPKNERIYLVDFGFEPESEKLDLYPLGLILIGLATGVPARDLPKKSGKLQFEERANLSSFFLYWLKRTIDPYPDHCFRSVKEALESLYSYQLILVSHDNFTKPYGSEVTLYKSERLLQVTISSKAKQRFFSNLQYQFRRFLPSIIFSVSLLTIVGAYRTKLLFFLIPVLLVAVLNLLFPSLSFELLKAFSKGDLELWLTSEKVTLSRYICWFKIPVLSPTDTDKIYQIERRNVSLILEEDRSIVIPPCLALIAGDREYTISASPDINEAELDWLAHQFSDWLGLPITRV